MKFAPEAILFDIDGVLVDVRRSYIDSIRKSVQLYLEMILLVRASSKDLLTREDVNRFKLLGGFNNDWDAVYGLLIYFQSLIERRGGFETRPYTRQTTIEDLRRLKNIQKLAKKLPIPCGIKNIRTLVKESQISYELAKDMFQETYLGEKLFKQLYGRKPLFNRSRGLILLEKLFISKKTLSAIKKAGLKLGIVTGRIRFEASYVLKRFAIERLFKAVVTHDDVAREEKRTGKFLRKPHPFSVLLAAKKMRAKSFLYVGDLPDDVRAANQAKKKIKIASAAFLHGASDQKKMLLEIKKAKPDFILNHPEDLRKFARG